MIFFAAGASFGINYHRSPTLQESDEKPLSAEPSGGGAMVFTSGLPKAKLEAREPAPADFTRMLCMAGTKKSSRQKICIDKGALLP